LLGLLLGVGLALVLERFDRRLRKPTDLAGAFGMPVLGTVPDSKALDLDSNATERGAALPFAEAEAFRLILSRLRYFNVDRDIRSLVVTSATPRSGKTTVALHLARTAAAGGAKVLLLDADLHDQAYAPALGLAPTPGLTEVLTNQSTLEDALQKVQTESQTNGATPRRDLDVLVSGGTPPNAAELIGSAEMARLIQSLTEEYDLIVIDTPPITVVADAFPLLKLAGGVVVVGDLGRTTSDEAADLGDQLRRLGAPILGVIGNRAAGNRGEHAYQG
jgi:capsular exopolysaccharide synthesis family protein